jgi:hypothetical protein
VAFSGGAGALSIHRYPEKTFSPVDPVNASRLIHHASWITESNALGLTVFDWATKTFYRPPSHGENPIATEDKRAIIKDVQATRGKAVRAEPIAHSTSSAKSTMWGGPDLEDELCQWVSGAVGPSLNRMDVLVWEVLAF